MKRFTVRLHADQFDKIARPSQPVSAVAELIWNSLDAECDEVEVVINRTEMDAVESVIVRDNGHGMTAEEVERDFVQLGGSWKKHSAQSKNGKRPLHGRQGEGRFRAFAIGHAVEWETTAATATGEHERVTVSGSMDLGEFEVSDPVVVADASPGTTVRVSRPREHANRLLADAARTELLVRFSLYLLRFPEITVVFDGDRLDPSALIANRFEVDLGAEIGAGHGTPILQILEWNAHGSALKPSLFLCTPDAGVLHENTEAVPSLKDYAYTAYVLWAGFGEHSSELELADLGHAVLTPVLDAARVALRAHLDAISAQRRIRIIDRWKAERIYPFEQEAETPAERRTRALFDLVAVTAAPAVSARRTEAKLTLRLLREALDESPAALQRVLREVLDLSAEQIADFDQLLNQTSLADIIQTTRLVTDRLDFLHDLEHMLFDKDNRRRLLERTQLHRILATRGWVFGEEYSVVISDRGLTNVLRAHREIIGAELDPVAPVLGDDGNPLIIDLLLSAVAAGVHDRRHLVIELKRPSVVLGLKELNQLDEYALTVIGDAQFKTEGVWWDFWLIGDDLDDKVATKARQRDRRHGIVSEGDNYRVWVRTWAEVLEENRRRLHFYRDHLNHTSPEDAALDATLSKYLGSETANDLSHSHGSRVGDH